MKEENLFQQGYRIEYLDGLRGLAAMIVCFGHFIGAFAPDLTSGDPAALFFQKYPAINFFVFSPCNILYNASLAVFIFFVLSGYVLSYPYFLGGDKKIILPGMYKRYFRLTIPVFFSCIIAYFCMTLNLFFHHKASVLAQSDFLASKYNFAPDLYNMVKFSLFDVYFNYNGKVSYNHPLWIMPIELFGSFFCLFLLLLFGSSRIRYGIYFLLLLLSPYNGWLFFLSPFVLGMMLCDITTRGDKKRMLLNNKIVLLILFATGIFLASFKSDKIFFYKALGNNLITDLYGSLSTFFYLNASAFLIICAISHSQFLKTFFSHRILLFLGRISFMIYLLHFIVLCSLSSFLYYILSSLGASQLICFTVTSAISIPVIILLSYVCHRFVETRSIHLSNKIAAILVSFGQRIPVAFKKTVTSFLQL
jgi:peptidoglycan/LPS O-acetylase OafA/YrhL